MNTISARYACLRMHAQVRRISLAFAKRINGGKRRAPRSSSLGSPRRRPPRPRPKRGNLTGGGARRPAGLRGLGSWGGADVRPLRVVTMTCGRPCAGRGKPEFEITVIFVSCKKGRSKTLLSRSLRFLLYSLSLTLLIFLSSCFVSLCVSCSTLGLYRSQFSCSLALFQCPCFLVWSLGN
jgi:hypothetical protein